MDDGRSFLWFKSDRFFGYECNSDRFYGLRFKSDRFSGGIGILECKRTIVKDLLKL
ncbi:MAG: hypothetical protein ACO3EZ_04370 [Prochlorotrichaceae cyanobacterium]